MEEGVEKGSFFSLKIIPLSLSLWTSFLLSSGVDKVVKVSHWNFILFVLVFHENY